MRLSPKIFALLSVLVLSACAEAELAAHVAKQIPGVQSKSQGKFKIGSPYKVQGKWYRPQESYTLVEKGIASWYGPNFHGKPTANGEVFDQNELTAAHRTLQIPSLVRVTNLENGRSLVVRVNDRGPFSRGRIIDLSKRAAELLGFKVQGTAKVKLEVLGPESRAVAEAAKRGEDTRGVEVAMNERMPERDEAPQSAAPQPLRNTDLPSHAGAPVPEPVMQEKLAGSTVSGHTSNGSFYPDPVVETVPVAPGQIFVQAGSFSQKANAENLARRLSSFGQAQVHPALVNGTQYYRVRVASQSVTQADQTLSALSGAGYNNAIIIVE